MADKRDILVRLLGEETVSRMAGRAEKGLDRFGDSLEATERDAEGLDRQITEVEADLKTLAVAFARTGDAADRIDISKAMRKQQAELNKLTKSRKMLPDFTSMGEDMAGQVSVGFAAKLGPLIARAPMAGMNPAALAIGAPLAAGAVTLVGTAVAGAIVGGVGLAGVVGGLKLAAKDARVKAAGKTLGDDIGAMMGRASRSFVPETLDAIEEVRAGALKMEPDFRRVFAAASKFVAPLTDGLMDAAENAMPGIIDAMESAGPVIDAMADGMRDIGTAVGESLSDLSEYADEGARALNLLFGAVEVGINATSDLLEGTAELYRWSERIGAVWTGNVPQLVAMTAAQRDAEIASGGLAGGLSGVMDTAVKAVGGTAALNERQKILTSSMREGIAAAGGLSAAFDRINGVALTAREAESNYQAAVDAVTASIKEHGKTLDQDTAAGRANDQQIRNLIATAAERAQAVYDNTLATKGQAAAETAAKATFEQSRQQLIKNLTQILGNKEAAKKLADQIMKIPTSWGTKVTADTAGATNRINTFIKKVRQLDGSVANVTVRVTTKGDHHIPGVGTSIKGAAHGGPVEGPGPKGVDSVLRMLAPGEHVVPADEVDAAGGHAGMERIRAALRGETSGWTAPAMARPGGRSSAQAAMYAAPVFQINATGASGLERVFVGWLVKAIRDAGGNPNVLGVGGGWS